MGSQQRIGLVTYWFNRGQATVGRQLRGALDALGHETFVLARPPTRGFVRGPIVARGDKWLQPRVEAASGFEVEASEYLTWVRRHSLDLVFFFQNYQFQEIAALRSEGVRTIGTFMREDFGHQHVEGASAAFTDIYALTSGDQTRFARLGIKAELVPWGCHPENIRDAANLDGPAVFLFPGGFLSRRKPVLAVLDAFANVKDPDARLILKVQSIPTPRNRDSWRSTASDLRRLLRGSTEQLVSRVTGRGAPQPDEPSFVRSPEDLLVRVDRDPRVRLLVGEYSKSEYEELWSEVNVCLGVARWEGLGLHLFEAVGALVPLIVNELEPMTEVVHDERSGLVVSGALSGETESGAPIHEVDVVALAAAMTRLCNPAERQRIRVGLESRRAELSWDRTTDALAALLESPCHPDRPCA